MNELVSIVLPVHNGERFLAQSIESCLSQTYQNIELIIVDDFSSDGSLDIARRYADSDKRVCVIINQKNERLPRSLNIGFKVSKGGYLTWTSDDNYYHSNAIGAMVEHLDNHLDIGLCYADEKIINVDTGRVGYNRCRGKYGAVEELPIYNPVGACFLYRREVLDKVGDYEAERELLEDWDYWFRISLKFKISHIPRVLYTYRAHSNSLTSVRFKEQQIQTIEYIKFIVFEYKDRLPDDIRMRMLLFAVGVGRTINNRQLAAECFLLASEISPDAKIYTSEDLIEYATWGS